MLLGLVAGMSHIRKGTPGMPMVSEFKEGWAVLPSSLGLKLCPSLGHAGGRLHRMSHRVCTLGSLFRAALTPDIDPCRQPSCPEKGGGGGGGPVEPHPQNTTSQCLVVDAQP